MNGAPQYGWQRIPGRAAWIALIRMPHEAALQPVCDREGNARQFGSIHATMRFLLDELIRRGWPDRMTGTANGIPKSRAKTEAERIFTKGGAA